MMNAPQTRYAHSEGHTDVVFSSDGKYIITCGADSDVRVWDGIEDDDPISYHIGNSATALAFKNERVYVATDVNSVFVFTFPDGGKDGLATRCEAPITQLCFSHDAKYIAAASCDMTIKVTNVDTFECKTFERHKAPVLSIDMDPKGKYLASSSCDGSALVWELDTQTCVKTLVSDLPKCNDFFLSKTLCRLKWKPGDGKALAVPLEKQVKLFSREFWDEMCSLTHSSLQKTASVVSWSDSGCLLAAGCSDGQIFVWLLSSKQCVHYFKPTKERPICCLRWNPQNFNQLVYTNSFGELGVFTGPFASEEKSETVPQNVPSGVFDDDDDDNTISVSKIIAETLGTSDAISKAGGGDDDDTDTVVSLKPVAPPRPTAQPPFQPSSTPIQLQHRFMTWNNVGIIKSYNTSEESSIDIEFHDASVHHALHFSNVFNHTLATLSTQAVLLAGGQTDDSVSKVTCMLLNSWDATKEWNIDLNENEEALGVCLGSDWGGVATSHHNLRLFSIGGLQKEVISIPGPLVSLSAHKHWVFVIYHSGQGVFENQNMSCIIFNVNSILNHYYGPFPVPLSPESRLSWCGFTDEGSPVIYDSEGVMNLQVDKTKGLWMPVANTTKHAAGSSDHHWVIGVSELEQTILCVPCKGARYPATLPRPAVIMLPLQVPVCDITSDKSQLEESLLRSQLLSNCISRLNRDGLDVSEAKEHNEKTFREVLMKLFALSCRNDVEMRALDVAQLMTSPHMLQLALKYAGKLRKLTLTQKLTELTQQLMENLQKEQDSQPVFTSRKRVYENTCEDVRQNGCASPEEEECPEATPETNPLLAAYMKKDPENPVFPNVLISQEKKNPFKKDLTTTSSNKGVKCFDDIKKDDLVRKRNMISSSSKHIKGFSKISKSGSIKQSKLTSNIKKKSDKEESKEVVAENNDKVAESNSKVAESNSKVAESSGKVGFSLWWEEHSEDYKTNNPDLSDIEITKLGVKAFRKLPAEEKQNYNEPKEDVVKPSQVTSIIEESSQTEQKVSSSEATEKNVKKRTSEQSDSSAKKHKTGSFKNKLSGFMFNTDK